MTQQKLYTRWRSLPVRLDASAHHAYIHALEEIDKRIVGFAVGSNERHMLRQIQLGIAYRMMPDAREAQEVINAQDAEDVASRRAVAD